MSIKATYNNSFFFFFFNPIDSFSGVQVFPDGASGKEPTCQSRRFKRWGFDPWVGKIPWRRAWKDIPIFLPGESHGQRSWTGYIHRVGHDWSDSMHACRYTRKSCFLLLIYRPAPYSSALLAFSHPGHFPEHFSGVHVPLELMLLDCTQSQTQIQAVVLFPLIWMLYSMKS